MPADIYMRILRDVDPADDPTLLSIVPKLLSPIPLAGVIGGDSLDMPFIKWMKLTSFSNSIGFSSGKERQVYESQAAHGNVGDEDYREAEYKVREVGYGTSAGSFSSSRGNAGDVASGPYVVKDWLNVNRTHTRELGVTRWGRGAITQSRTDSAKRKSVDSDWKINRGSWSSGRKGSQFRAMPGFWDRYNNRHLNIDLPGHNDVEFTKNVDNATPQLAYACSSQHPIGTAVILFRRRIGLGVRGIRVPFMAVMLSKCLMTGWSLSGEDESCSMQYEEIAWCTYDQIADFNVATGMSNRTWDTESKKGGESTALYVMMGAIAAAAMAGAGIDTLATGVGGGQGQHVDDSKEEKELAADSDYGSVTKLE